MADVENYFGLLDEYRRVVSALLKDLGAISSYPPPPEAIYIEQEFRLLDAYLHEAAGHEEGSAEKAAYQALALRTAEILDSILYEFFREAYKREEWGRHQDQVQSIIGRWPGVRPKR